MKFQGPKVEVVFLSSEFLFQGWVSGKFLLRDSEVLKVPQPGPRAFHLPGSFSSCSEVGLPVLYVGMETINNLSHTY